MKFSTLLFLSLPGFSFLVLNVSAQVTDTGRETGKGTLNFTEKAKYEHSHPAPLIIKNPENEENEAFHFVPPIPDSSQININWKTTEAYRTSDLPSSLLPASPTPTDTFESTSDNGTTIPPDTHGAIDATHCVTAINPNVHIQNRSGGNISIVSLDGFWSPILSGGGAFDPRVHYDPYANRWIIVSDCGARSTSSALLIAISKTGDPTGAWWEYKVTADATGVNWLDFPCVGFNGKWVIITGNMFANSGGGYNGAKVFIFNKANLLSGAGATYTSFLQTGSFSIAPALTYSATEPNLFAVENWNGSAGVMHVWKITGPVGGESMTSVGFPGSSLHWWYTSFPVSGTSGADFAPQAGTSNKIQTNDDRVTQTIFMNNTLWFAHTVFLPYNPSANPTRTSVQWWQTDTLANPLQTGLIDDPASVNFYAFPSIAPNSANDALIGFSAFSALTHPSCAYALHAHADATDSTRPLIVYRHGMSSYFKTFGGSQNRWGDFSATIVDPVNLSDFWTIQEASSPTANFWDTWWAFISFCSPPASITGSMPFCAAATITLNDATAGGTWSSSNTAVATVSSSGLLTGVASGTAIITYALSSGCFATTSVTVNPSPVPIIGPSALCTGSSITLTDAISGGVWQTTGSVISVNASTGVVTGLSAGAATVTYTVPSGCLATKLLAVNAIMPPISGSAATCVGQTTTLTDATAGGTWSSSNPSLAIVGATTGIVTGIATGTAAITYATGSGCSATIGVTVDPSPAPLSGTRAICQGATATLSDGTPGGFWTSGAPSVAGVSSTGVVTGISAGMAAISYFEVMGCYATGIVTVNQSPSAISGPVTGCQGTNFTLTDAVSGGAWSSSNTAVATVVAGTGTVTSLAAGRTTITYTLPDACMTEHNLAVQVCSATGTSQIVQDSSSIEILPNPNRGEFTITGNLGTPGFPTTDNDIFIEITGMSGQIVYTGKINIPSGTFSEHIELGRSIADGIYTVRLLSASDSRFIKMIITK